MHAKSVINDMPPPSPLKRTESIPTGWVVSSPNVHIALELSVTIPFYVDIFWRAMKKTHGGNSIFYLFGGVSLFMLF